jgi:hypothetical protein
MLAACFAWSVVNMLIALSRLSRDSPPLAKNRLTIPLGGVRGHSTGCTHLSRPSTWRGASSDGMNSV